MNQQTKRIVLAITGASGVIYGSTLLKELKNLKIETHLIVSSYAKQNLSIETDTTYNELKNLADKCYDESDMCAQLASGSFLHDGMIICPCSMKTLSAVANGYASNLITRAADVTLKEQRKLILVTRETPLSAIHLENMLKLARIGATIMPPLIAFYQKPKDIDECIKQFIGRILDLLNIKNNLVNRWQSKT